MCVQFQRPSFRGRVSRFLRGTRRWRLPFALLSSGLVLWLAPGLIGVWFAVLFVLFGSLARPWRVHRPPTRRVWSPVGQQWLRQQRRSSALCSPSSVPSPPRVYVLWSAEQWAARSAALPWQRRSRFFTRGPV
jgi:hypothetical protein